MKFEDSAFFKEIKHYKLVMDYGTYFFCEKFIVGELNEGVHFDLKKANLIVSEIIAFYGKEPKTCLISNRVNGYSVNPLVWTDITAEYPDLLIASCIVSYSSVSHRNTTLEKQFTNQSIKRCNSLEEAINWVSQLCEFN
jgi:hypothetical protein